MKRRFALLSVLFASIAVLTLEAQSLSTIDIVCNEPGASVFINGKLVGYTKPNYVQPLAAGAYVVRVEKQGFQPWENTVQVSGKVVRVQVNLSSGGSIQNRGKLEAPRVVQSVKKYRYGVHSNIKGASVYINGAFKGNTPVIIELEEGVYELKVQASGYSDHVSQVNLRRDEEFIAQLQPSSYSLNVRSNVSGAEVFLNGSFVGKTPFRSDVAGGSYRIEVRAPGYTSWESNVSINSASTFDATLVPMSGRVEVIIPSSVMDRNNRRDVFQLYVNGALQSGLQVELSPGRHTIKVVSGALAVERAVVVEAGKTYRVELSASLNVR